MGRSQRAQGMARARLRDAHRAEYDRYYREALKALPRDEPKAEGDAT